MMKSCAFATRMKRAAVLLLSLILACTAFTAVPRGYAQETVDLHKYQQKALAVEAPDTLFSLRKASMFDGYKYYYTPLEEERDMYKGLGWEDMGEVTPAAQQLYNLRNPETGEFYFTTNKLEYDHIVALGWEDRGLRYAAADSESGTPVYRLFHNGGNPRWSHYFTRDAAERDYLIEHGWDGEGIEGYSTPETEEDLATVLEELNPSKPDTPGTGITVTGNTGILASGKLQGANIPANASISVQTKPITSGSTFTDLNASLGQHRIGNVYEISLMVNGKEVHSGFGELTLSLPVDARYNNHIVIVYHHQGSAGITKLRAIAKNGYVSFVVTSLSGFALEDTGVEAQTMYRLYNPNSGEHFYTSSTVERDATVKAGWNDEGVGWIAPKTSSVPVYRLYSGTDHHYTTSAFERDELVKAGWSIEGDNPEGIAWYSDDAKTVPLYRQFNPNVDPSAPTGNSGSHNYTVDLNEHKSLVSLGWHDENIGWYAVAAK